MNVIWIESLDDVALAPYARLTEAQLLNRLHPEAGLFICESLKVIRVALERGVVPVSFLCEEKHLECVNALMCGDEVPVYTAPREVLKSLTGYELSRGVLCCMRRPKLPTVADVLNLRPSGEIDKSNKNKDSWMTPQAGDDGVRRVAVLDSVVNSENTGAIFRAAASLGMDAVLLTRTCCDPLNRRACRVSMGTVFQLPWTFIDGVKNGESGRENYPLALKEFGFETVAMALTDRSVPIDAPELKRIKRMAVVLGTEGDGLSESVLRMADHVARIPMQQGVDSLNVAAAAAVAFWELNKRP